MRQDLFRFFGNHIPKIAILILRARDGTHTGLIYRDEDGNLRLLQFCLSGEINDQPWDGKTAHVILDLGEDEDALSNLSGLCQTVAQRHDGPPQYRYPYGFKMGPDSAVLPDGALYLGEDGAATCASFILLILFQARIELVVRGPDWPHRPNADDAKHAALVELYQRHYPNQERRSRMLSQLPCPRVAPEEIAGAVMCPDPPASQQFAERAAKWIMGLFDYNRDFNDYTPPT